MNDKTMKRVLGTCYYPEQWPKDVWRDDARRMVEAGLTWVRVSEFAWSRLEAQPGILTFDWLDEAIEILGNAGLKVVLGTPTATPPRWMIDKYPDMLACDANGHQRKFGSRRHYCFSHLGYREECKRIVEIFAQRYGQNQHVCAWQTDNEYGCHDTILSYSKAAQNSFHIWLEQRYETIEALNEAWGNVFWSMDYNSFAQIELPNLTVTEANPSHQLAFRRFSSDQVISFNRVQTDIIRQYSNSPITHNFMGRVTDFDHYKVGDDLDFSCWDTYPLGFLEDRIKADDAHKQKFLKQGDPDFQAFHHDLYRTVGHGRWWVMEQQPGPVNWARYNPAPLPGMVKLWTWEAIAHGAEAVCYFRWRQAPFAQEQMHSGLLRPDSKPAAVMDEVADVCRDLVDAGEVCAGDAKVGLVYDYDAEAGWDIQPHGAHLSYFDLVFDHYKTLRSLGLSVDILPPTTAELSQYKLVLVPGLITLSDEFKAALSTFTGSAILGPRTGAKTLEFHTPVPLPPDVPGMDGVSIAYAESLPEGHWQALAEDGSIGGYVENLEGEFETLIKTDEGRPAVIRLENIIYVAGCLDKVALKQLLQNCCAELGVETIDLPDGVRIRDTKTERFWFNYLAEPIEIMGMNIPAAGVQRVML